MSELRLAVELIWTAGTRRQSAEKYCGMMTRWAREEDWKSGAWWLDMEENTGWRSGQLRTGKSPRGHSVRLEFHSGKTGSEFGVSTVWTWIRLACCQRLRQRFLFVLCCQLGCCAWLSSNLHDHRGPSSAGSTGRKMDLWDYLLTIFVPFCVLDLQLETTFSKFNTKSIKLRPGRLEGPQWMCGTVVWRTVVEILAVSALIHRFDRTIKHVFLFFLLQFPGAAPSDQCIYFLLQSRLRLAIGFLFGSSNKEKAAVFACAGLWILSL